MIEYIILGLLYYIISLWYMCWHWLYRDNFPTMTLGDFLFMLAIGWIMAPIWAVMDIVRSFFSEVFALDRVLFKRKN